MLYRRIFQNPVGLATASLKKQRFPNFRLDMSITVRIITKTNNLFFTVNTLYLE